MLPFQQARKRHANVDASARIDVAVAGDLWSAVTGQGAREGTYAEAVADTVPAEHATLLVASDVAAAYAFQLCLNNVPYSPRATPLNMRDAARAAWATFADRATSTEEMARGFGWDLSQAWTILKDVSTHGNVESVKRIAKLAGRMYASMRGSRASRVHGIPEEVHSVEMGSNLARLLPSELVQLGDDVFEVPAIARILEGRALQYAMRGQGKRGQGPLVLALDESASMHAQRREWSKACAIALMRVAFDQKRPVAVVHYSSSVTVRQIKPGDAQAVVDMIRHWLDGGTAIGQALAVAVEQVKALAAKGQNGADIVLVTDGEDPNHQAMNVALDAAAVVSARLWTVAIECDLSPTSPIRARAAHHVTVNASDMCSDKSANPLAGAAA